MKIGRYESSDKSNVGTAVTFMMIGVGVGALVGLLLAPKTGKQMRKDLRRKFDDAKDTLGDWRDDAKEFAENAQEFAEDAIERGSEIVDEVRERSGKIADEVRDRVTPLAKSLRRR